MPHQFSIRSQLVSGTSDIIYERFAIFEHLCARSGEQGRSHEVKHCIKDIVVGCPSFCFPLAIVGSASMHFCNTIECVSYLVPELLPYLSEFREVHQDVYYCFFCSTFALVLFAEG